MTRLDVPQGRRGDPVTADAWERMRAANRATRLIAGTGVRLVEVPDGTIINFDSAGGDFSHPWQAALRGTDTATIRSGTINLVEAAIKGVPLAGTDKQPPPALRFGKPKLDKEGRGYLCAEVTCDPKKDWSILKVEIVQVADPDTDDGSPGKTPNTTGAAAALSDNRARHALAQLRERKSGRIELFQIAFLPVQHRVDLAADGKTASRHFFW